MGTFYPRKILAKIQEMCGDLYECRNGAGLTPAGLACKLGKVRIVQWILHNVQPNLFSEGDADHPNVLEISTMFDQSELVLWMFSELERKGLPRDFRNSAGD